MQLSKSRKDDDRSVVKDQRSIKITSFRIYKIPKVEQQNDEKKFFSN
jgi:hypothetical protein